MSFKLLLWDVDGTLLNFMAAEKAALRTCAEKFEIGFLSDQMIARYSLINKKYWEALERGEITKDRVLVGRFEEFFETEGLDVSKAEAFNSEYQVRLGDTCVINDGGDQIVKEIKGRGIPQYVVTNGTIVAQERKLKNSGLGPLFDGVFISDRIGHEKPTMGFFDAVFEKLSPIMEENGIEKDEILIIGDSLTSDMRGGNNAGIRNCWYNPGKAENKTDVQIDYEIDDLNQVLDLL